MCTHICETTLNDTSFDMKHRVVLTGSLEKRFNCHRALSFGFAPSADSAGALAKKVKTKNHSTRFHFIGRNQPTNQPTNEHHYVRTHRSNHFHSTSNYQRIWPKEVEPNRSICQVTQIFQLSVTKACKNHPKSTRNTKLFKTLKNEPQDNLISFHSTSNQGLTTITVAVAGTSGPPLADAPVRVPPRSRRHRSRVIAPDVHHAIANECTSLA